MGYTGASIPAGEVNLLKQVVAIMPARSTVVTGEDESKK
jgi:hypothetical protein